MSKRALEPNLDEDEELFKGASPAAAKKLKKENDRAKEKGKEKGKETKKVVSMRSFLQERDAEDGETLESFLDSLTRSVVSKEKFQQQFGKKMDMGPGAAPKKPKPPKPTNPNPPQNKPHNVPNRNNNQNSASNGTEEQQDGHEVKANEKREPTPAPDNNRPKLLPQHPFTTDDDDHCETSKVAYEDIETFLTQLVRLMGKTKTNVKIYDPYFCAGSIKRNLLDLGFPNVYNENEDFYQVVAEKRLPDFDILITNPPYSEDHIEKCVKFAVECGKPWFLLLPTFVYTKEYYLPSLKGAFPVYLSPKKRYNYWSPNRKSETSPFVSFWYIDVGKYRDRMVQYWTQNNFNATAPVTLSLNTWKLPANMKDSNDDTRVRLRKNQRDSLKKKAQQQDI